MDLTMEKIGLMKELYLKMDLDARRTRYACEDDYVVLDSVKTWTQYVVDHNLKPSIREENQNEKVFPIDDEINSKISLWQGDITHLEVDAVVNAANMKLLGGSGVDGCIHRAAGDNLLEECKTLNGCEAGSAKISGGYKLPAKYVIHAVGPMGENPKVLTSTYETCLNLMLENKLRSAACCCISTGIFGYPPKKAIHVAANTVRKFLEDHKTEVDRIIFTVFLDSDKKIYEEELFTYFPTKPTETNPEEPKSTETNPEQSKSTETNPEEPSDSLKSPNSPKLPTSGDSPNSPKLLTSGDSPNSPKLPTSGDSPKL